jgi:hypothetical protein
MNFQVFRALRHGNFGLFAIGQMLSISGTWMQRVAQGRLAYRLTGSAFYLGLLTFAASAPAFLLTPLAGVMADPVNPRRDRGNPLERIPILRVESGGASCVTGE